MNREEKYQKLKEILKDLESVVVAYSGGVDSTFLLHVATEVLKGNVLGVTGDFSANPRREIKESIEISNSNNYNHEIVKLYPLENEKVKCNVPDRCYFCKNEIFSKLLEFAEKKGFKYVVDGTNASDCEDDRPGMKALKELGIVSPLKMAGLTKDDIRFFSKVLNLPTWENPSSPCLMTRFPFNTEITHELLQKVESAEDFLKKIGFSDLRVRDYGSTARIEFLESEIEKATKENMRKKIVNTLKTLGYEFVTIDLQGLRTGSMNL